MNKLDIGIEERGNFGFWMKGFWILTPELLNF
jgi:hypothetical protein